MNQTLGRVGRSRANRQTKKVSVNMNLKEDRDNRIKQELSSNNNVLRTNTHNSKNQQDSSLSPSLRLSKRGRDTPIETGVDLNNNEVLRTKVLRTVKTTKQRINKLVHKMK